MKIVNFAISATLIGTGVLGISLAALNYYSENQNREIHSQLIPGFNPDDPHSQEKILWGGEKQYQDHLQKTSNQAIDSGETEEGGDPDPETLRKIGDPPPRAEPGGRWTQKELDRMTRSYELGLAIEEDRKKEEAEEAYSQETNESFSALVSSNGGKLSFPLWKPGIIRWGRNENLLLQASDTGTNPSDFIRLTYCEYQLAPDDTFRLYGVMGAQPFVAYGEYSIDNDKILFIYQRVIAAKSEKSKKDLTKYLQYEEAKLVREPVTGRRMFSTKLETYVEDYWWDGLGYRDSSGKRYSDRKQRSTNTSDDECAKNLKEAREYFVSLTEEQMKGDPSVEIPNRLLGCPVHNESYIFNSKKRTVECRKGG